MSQPRSTHEILIDLDREMTIVEAIHAMEDAIVALRRQRNCGQRACFVATLDIVIARSIAAREAATQMKGD